MTPVLGKTGKLQSIVHEIFLWLLERKFLVSREEINGSETFLKLIFPKKIDSLITHYTSRFPFVTRKCCYLLGKLKKHV